MLSLAQLLKSVPTYGPRLPVMLVPLYDHHHFIYNNTFISILDIISILLLNLYKMSLRSKSSSDLMNEDSEEEQIIMETVISEQNKD
jgi:hypothetical protein